MRAGRPRRSARGFRLSGWAVVAGLGLLLAGCAMGGDVPGEFPQSVFDPAGPVARQQDQLWQIVFPIAVAVFILVQGGLLYLVFRYRQHDDDTTAPTQVHGNTRLEIFWTIIPALILAGIAVPTVQSIFDLAGEPDDALQVRVIGKQFWWEFQYTGEDGLGVVTANELYIPTDRPVFLSMEALHPGLPDQVDPVTLDYDDQLPGTLDGVIHSFWVPRLAGKQDVVPGHRNQMTIEADAPGVYQGQCAEFCGIAHAEMRFQVVAMDPAEFDQWLVSQSEPSPGLDDLDGLTAEGYGQFEEAGCIACHAIQGYETSGGDAAEVRIGPDLSHFASRNKFGGGLFDNEDPEQLAAWLRDPQQVKPGAQMPRLGLSEDQIEALVAFLQSLE